MEIKVFSVSSPQSCSFPGDLMLLIVKKNMNSTFHICVVSQVNALKLLSCCLS